MESFSYKASLTLRWWLCWKGYVLAYMCLLFRLRSWALWYFIMPVIHWNYISALNARYECGARRIYSWERRRCELAVRCGRFSSLWAPPDRIHDIHFLSSISSKLRTFSFIRYMDGYKKSMRIRSSFTYNIHFIVFRNFIEEAHVWHEHNVYMYCRGRMFVYFCEALTFKRHVQDGNYVFPWSSSF